tara:strand:+ start:142 stop:318 length:177 start_codon:yes stop_codon:yes gene_type:complete
LILVNAIYNPALKISIPIISTKLKENMMINSEARMETIIKENREMGRPNMTARFLIFL